MNNQLVVAAKSADQFFYLLLVILGTVGGLVYIYVIRPKRQNGGNSVFSANPEKVEENKRILNVLPDSTFADLFFACYKLTNGLENRIWDSKRSMEVLKAITALGKDRKDKKTTQREYRGNPSAVARPCIDYLNGIVSNTPSLLNAAENKGLDFGIITTSAANLAAYHTVDALERRKNVTTVSYNIHKNVETCLVTMIEQLRTECYIPGAGPALLSQKANRNDVVTSSDCSENENIASAGINKIDASTFKDHDQLTSVTLPEGITVIDEKAFSNATGLTSITLPNSIHEIGFGAFWGCTGLTSITLPDGLYKIGGRAFSGCTGLTSITLPNSIYEIDGCVFSDCTGLTSITLPNSITKVDFFAFSDCTGLTSITLPNSITKVGSGVFSGCTGLTSITLPDGLHIIGFGAFQGCTGLTNITLPNSIHEIGLDAFRGCTGLTSITLPDGLHEIGDRAFLGCTGLTNIKIPKSLKKIGNEAFSGCTGLTSITLPDVLPSFGKKVFADADSLCKINYNGNEQYITKDFFGNTIPKELIPQTIDLYPHMTTYAIKQYILKADIWKNLDQNLQTEIFFSHHEKTLMPKYAEVINFNLASHLGTALCNILKQTPSEKNCGLAASFLLTFKEIIGDEQKENIYSLLKTCKYGAKALQSIEEDNNT